MDDYVDKSYCKNVYVQGFTTVVIKDSLNRSIETLHGFFHQGYWLADFLVNIDTFYRSSPDDGIQDFIFQTKEDTDLHLKYYIVARATQTDGNHYSSFNACSENPILLVAHKPTEDFKNSLFQTSFLKQAQLHLKDLCPQSQKFQILGINDALPPQTDRVIFQADINLADDSITTVYHQPIDKSDIPKPTELRKESGENLLTIHPDKKEQSKPAQDQPAPTIKRVKNKGQSAIDLALIARVSGKAIPGETVVYIDHTDSAYFAIATQPLPLMLKTQTTLSPGWYFIKGEFNADNERMMVLVSSAQLCQKEWCLDEE